MKSWLFVIVGIAALVLTKTPSHAAVQSEPTKHVVVIPIHDEISKPTLFILRRGLKEAIEKHADLVVLDLKTPGGEIDVTLDMIEALEKYPGKTVAYVNDEAMSAGAFISAVTQEIWFSPKGVIGAAAPVSSTGQDVESTMKQKLVSYLKARMRSISEGKGYRGEVVSAMIDAESELKIAGHLIKQKGELLSLTASEAMKTYGEPAVPLLGAGISEDLTQLLNQKLGDHSYTVNRLEITWSEKLAVTLNRFEPLGLSCEYKVVNTGKVALPWCPGHHFYFTIPWTEDTKRSDYSVRIQADKTLKQNAQGLLTEGPLLKETENLAEPAIIDTFHTRLRSNEAVVSQKGNGGDIVVKVGTNKVPDPSATFVTWSLSPESPFFCVEPWMGPANAPENKVGLQWVEPRATATFNVSVHVK